MIYQHLFDRVETPATVRAGLIGAGQFGTPIVTQAPNIPRLDVPVVADVDVEAGRRAFRLAGFAEDEILVCESRAAALRALEAGQRVVLQDALLMMDLPRVNSSAYSISSPTEMPLAIVVMLTSNFCSWR